MKVSVVIVSYNPKKWIAQCFSSLESSTIPLDVIVIDNGSKDGSPEIIKSQFPKVEIIQSQTNLGFGQGNNLGIRMAYDNGADYVFLLNQDAWIEPDTIEKLIAASQNQPDFGIVSPMHLNGDGSGLDYNFSLFIQPLYCKDLYSDTYLRKVQSKLYEVKFVNAAAWLITRNCIETVGGFSPSFFHYGEDDNYVQRVKFHGLKVGVYPLAQIFHDREQRPTNEFFTDTDILFTRNIIFKYSDPLNKEQLEDLQKSYFSSLFKSALLLRFKQFQSQNHERNLIKSTAIKSIADNRAMSLKKGMSFL